MSLPPNINDLEKQKFTEVSGKPAVDINPVTLPPNASTETTQSEINDSLNAIEPDTDAIRVEQLDQGVSLDEINAGIPVSLGQKAMVDSMPIVVASNQTSVPIKTRDADDVAITLGQKLRASSFPVTMASDTLIYGNAHLTSFAFSAAANVNMVTAGADNPLIYLRNPNGSGKVIYLYFAKANTTVGNVIATFSIFANPTASANGTDLTEATRNVGGGASAVGLATTAPTITSSGTLMEVSVAGQNTTTQVLGEYFSIAIQPNNSILITGNPASNNRNASVSVAWIEI